MLTHRRRITGLLGDRSLTPFWLARLAERVGDWVVLLTILVASWDRTGDASVASWALALWLVPRIVVVGLLEPWTRRLSPAAWPFITAAKSLIVVAAVASVALSVVPESELFLGAAGVMGFLAALSGEARTTALRQRLGLARLGAGAGADAFVDRLGLLVGALLAGGLLYAVVPGIAMGAAATVLAVAAILAYAETRDTASKLSTAASTTPPPLIEPDEARLVARRMALYLVVAFMAGALGTVLVIATLPLSALPNVGSATPAPLLVAAAALGMLIGPLPVPRLLLRIPAPLLLLATVVVTAAVAIAIALTKSTMVAIPGLIVFGLAAVTQDALRAIAVRRLASGPLFERAARLSLLALTVGQIYGSVGIVSIADLDPFAILIVLGGSQILLVALGIATGGRSALRIGGLSALPIKSVVHQLSWDTNPPPVPAPLATLGAGTGVGTAAASGQPRAKRLARWINRQVELQKLTVTLPISRREYEIFRPDDASRERLFEQGRADPDKQMPYWAKVWPSGVALADVVVERKEEVADAHVLELGAGLGVTACTVLEYGGHIVTADYSALPLAHCRLNTLYNTDRAPVATCFNWRHLAEVEAAAASREFRNGFPLIIAGDVLYEGRDAEPLLNVIERMLVADGSLWLAEPVRWTAQRFLDSAAALGWEVESRQVKADWPDATDGPVNVHFLRRSPEPDRIAADLGGLRL